MITELRIKDYDKIKPLLEVEHCNLEIESVALRHNPGWIFVDNEENPESAIVWSKGITGFYLIGKVTKEFVEELGGFFDREIIPRAKALGYKWIEMSGTHQGWNQVMDQVFGSRQDFGISYQRVYGIDAIRSFSSPTPPLREGARVEIVSNELLQSAIGNLDMLEKNILEWWDNVELFLEKGIGYVVIYDEQIVTTCVTSFLGDGLMQSHIETHEDYRKMGFAKCAVHAFIMACKEKGICTYWDCMDTNVGSFTLAEYFGYTLKQKYPLYYFRLA